MIFLLRKFLAASIKFNVVGLQNFPISGPIILAANHTRSSDILMLLSIFPRSAVFPARENLFDNPIRGKILRVLGGYPLEKGEKDAWAMDHAKKVLRHKQALVMFPEGRQSPGRGLQVAKTGTARLAIEAGCPIIPVTIAGADQSQKRRMARDVVNIQFLQAMKPQVGESPLALTDRLMFTLAEALPLSLRGVYVERPAGFMN
jgi:1-acyl-sn-glycerol-3-phosphate acyltransferase